jgi:ribonucleotide reductase alpha subunit
MLITKIIKPKFKIPNFTDKSILSVDCGEQILPVGGACLLGSINLTQFIDFENKNWDYESLEEYIPWIVRFMDNVNDITYVPLDSQKEEIKSKRRIGLGIMGYGSALYMLNLKYGGKEALKITDSLMSFISNKAYQASALLAKEKGAFKSYTPEYLESNFIKTLWPETIALIKEYGTRNSHLMSIQPTGNCVRKSTKIRTTSGIMSIADIFEKNNINIDNTLPDSWYIPTEHIEVETLDGPRRITGLYANNNNEVYSVKTESGNLIEGTNEHKVLVKIDDETATWKRLCDLKINDKIIVLN